MSTIQPKPTAAKLCPDPTPPAQRGSRQHAPGADGDVEGGREVNLGREPDVLLCGDIQLPDLLWQTRLQGRRKVRAVFGIA